MDNEFERITPPAEDPQPALEKDTAEQISTDALSPALRNTQKRTVIRTRAPKVTSPKPLVEGVNAPATENTAPARVPLTSAEKQLIADPDAIPVIRPLRQEHLLIPDQTGRSGHRAIWGLVITLIIVAGGIGWFFWYEGMLPWHPSPAQTEDNAMIYNNLNNKNNPATAGTSTTPDSQDSAAAPTGTPATVTDPGAASTTPDTANKKVTVSSTPTGYLNVRSEPSTSGKLVTQVAPGDTLVYTETKNGWYHVVLPSGATGWIIGQYATEVK